MRSRLISIVLAGSLVPALSGCQGSVIPTPVLSTEAFSGTLQPLGTDFHAFTIHSQGDLTMTITSLTSVATGADLNVTIGAGFGVLSGTQCQVQISAATATVGQELTVPNGASPGTYCAAIFDLSTLTAAAAYRLTVKHY